MDIYFIIFIVLGIIGVPFLVASFLIKKEERRPYDETSGRSLARVTGVIVCSLAALFFFWSCFTILDPLEVGVLTTNGTVSDEVLTSGFHWKNPASVVHKWDGAVRTEKYSTDSSDQGDPIQARMAIGSIAKVNVTFQWKLEGDKNFINIFKNYRDPDNLDKNVVKRALQQAVGESFSTYNPYAALIAAQIDPTKPNVPGTQQVAIVSYSDLQDQAMTKLKKILEPQGVLPYSLTFSNPEYDSPTQDNLNKLSASITATQVAIQNEKTATAQAEANRILNGQPANSQTVTQLCLQNTLKGLEDGKSFPNGWNCFGPTPFVNTSK